MHACDLVTENDAFASAKVAIDHVEIRVAHSAGRDVEDQTASHRWRCVVVDDSQRGVRSVENYSSHDYLSETFDDRNAITPNFAIM